MTPASRPASASRERIVQGWQVCAAAPAEGSFPDFLTQPREWIDLPEPALAAAALRSVGRWSLDGPARRFDADDWWYRVEFDASPPEDGSSLWLGFDGLAGVAEVWLNGELLARSTNMFVACEHEIGQRLHRGGNTLVLRFHALDTLLAQRRPRPRWRAPMVEHQQLRWFRNTLLGRTPGWSPPAAAVGVWKDVWLERRAGLQVSNLTLRASVADGAGRVDLACALEAPAGQRVMSAVLELDHEGQTHRASLVPGPMGAFTVSAAIEKPTLWWPHTHGTPALYTAQLLVQLEGESAPRRVPLGRLGFRTIEADTTDGGFSLRVNGVPVFCRGACWTPLDAVSLRATPEACRAAVAQVRDAGMNMLRVAGTGVYEDSAFFDACDALGVLVWQDFMFANMDYPEGDDAFMASVRDEATQQLAIWQARPSLAVLCGNSEVEQQAAMWGAARELWQPPLFHETLAQWARAALPGVPYWPSSAHGGAFPHQSNAGTSSYYGVGAYLRPAADARRADLRFATECLAFANVPEDSTVARMPGGLGLRVHHPGWKARTPRDLGAGWDFEDVRDHYLAEHFGIDALKCRYADHERYLALSRAVTGEMMSAAFTEWRRPGSRCGGALVLFLRDLWAGAGWGLIDDAGVPKPCFYALSRALQPQSVAITDEGGNGLVAHVTNELAEDLHGELQLTLYGSGDAVIEQTRSALQVGARSGLSLPLAARLGHFLDLSYAYRFGPPPVTLVHTRMSRPDGSVVGEAFFLPAGAAPGPRQDLGLRAQLVTGEGGQGELLVSSERFAHTVHLDLDGAAPADNYFHLAPGVQRRIALRPSGSVPVKGRVSALNADRAITLQRA